MCDGTFVRKVHEIFLINISFVMHDSSKHIHCLVSMRLLILNKPSIDSAISDLVLLANPCRFFATKC